MAGVYDVLTMFTGFSKRTTAWKSTRRQPTLFLITESIPEGNPRCSLSPSRVRGSYSPCPPDLDSNGPRVQMGQMKMCEKVFHFITFVLFVLCFFS